MRLRVGGAALVHFRPSGRADSIRLDGDDCLVITDALLLLMAVTSLSGCTRRQSVDSDA